MEKTYITRRIDELGRLVIPKEIRKNLKIKDNDELEINVVDNKIVLYKYESVNKDNVISILIDIIKKKLNKNVLFTSRDSIIDYSLISKEIICDTLLSDQIMNIIEKRKMYINNGVIFINNMEINCSYLINPIIINGDIYGSIIIYGNSEITSKDEKIIDFVNNFLENYLE